MWSGLFSNTSKKAAPSADAVQQQQQLKMDAVEAYNQLILGGSLEKLPCPEQISEYRSNVDFVLSNQTASWNRQVAHGVDEAQQRETIQNYWRDVGEKYRDLLENISKFPDLGVGFGALPEKIRVAMSDWDTWVLSLESYFSPSFPEEPKKEIESDAFVCIGQYLSDSIDGNGASSTTQVDNPAPAPEAESKKTKLKNDFYVGQWVTTRVNKDTFWMNKVIALDEDGIHMHVVGNDGPCDFSDKRSFKPATKEQVPEFDFGQKVSVVGLGYPPDMIWEVIFCRCTNGEHVYRVWLRGTKQILELKQSQLLAAFSEEKLKMGQWVTLSDSLDEYFTYFYKITDLIEVDGQLESVEVSSAKGLSMLLRGERISKIKPVASDHLPQFDFGDKVCVADGSCDDICEVVAFSIRDGKPLCCLNNLVKKSSSMMEKATSQLRRADVPESHDMVLDELEFKFEIGQFVKKTTGEQLIGEVVDVLRADGKPSYFVKFSEDHTEEFGLESLVSLTDEELTKTHGYKVGQWVCVRGLGRSKDLFKITKLTDHVVTAERTLDGLSISYPIRKAPFVRPLPEQTPKFDIGASAFFLYKREWKKHQIVSCSLSGAGVLYYYFENNARVRYTSVYETIPGRAYTELCVDGLKVGQWIMVRGRGFSWDLCKITHLTDETMTVIWTFGDRSFSYPIHGTYSLMCLSPEQTPKFDLGTLVFFSCEGEWVQRPILSCSLSKVGVLNYHFEDNTRVCYTSVFETIPECPPKNFQVGDWVCSLDDKTIGEIIDVNLNEKTVTVKWSSRHTACYYIENVSFMYPTADQIPKFKCNDPVLVHVGNNMLPGFVNCSLLREGRLMYNIRGAEFEGHYRNLAHEADKVFPGYKVGDWVFDKQFESMIGQITNVGALWIDIKFRPSYSIRKPVEELQSIKLVPEEHIPVFNIGDQVFTTDGNGNIIQATVQTCFIDEVSGLLYSLQDVHVQELELFRRKPSQLSKECPNPGYKVGDSVFNVEEKARERAIGQIKEVLEEKRTIIVHWRADHGENMLFEQALNRLGLLAENETPEFNLGEMVMADIHGTKEEACIYRRFYDGYDGGLFKYDIRRVEVPNFITPVYPSQLSSELRSKVDTLKMQQLAIKEEPKFNVGEWVFVPHERTFVQVAELLDNGKVRVRVKYLQGETRDYKEEDITKCKLDLPYSIGEQVKLFDESISNLVLRAIVTRVNDRGHYIVDTLNVCPQSRNVVVDGISKRIEKLNTTTQEKEKPTSSFKVGDWVFTRDRKYVQLVKILDNGKVRGMVEDDDLLFDFNETDIAKAQIDLPFSIGEEVQLSAPKRTRARVYSVNTEGQYLVSVLENGVSTSKIRVEDMSRMEKVDSTCKQESSFNIGDWVSVRYSTFLGQVVEILDSKTYRILFERQSDTRDHKVDELTKAEMDIPYSIGEEVNYRPLYKSPGRAMIRKVDKEGYYFVEHEAMNKALVCSRATAAQLSKCVRKSETEELQIGDWVITPENTIGQICSYGWSEIAVKFDSMDTQSTYPFGKLKKFEGHKIQKEDGKLFNIGELVEYRSSTDGPYPARVFCVNMEGQYVVDVDKVYKRERVVIDGNHYLRFPETQPLPKFVINVKVFLDCHRQFVEDLKEAYHLKYIAGREIIVEESANYVSSVVLSCDFHDLITDRQMFLHKLVAAYDIRGFEKLMDKDYLAEIIEMFNNEQLWKHGKQLNFSCAMERLGEIRQEAVTSADQQGATKEQVLVHWTAPDANEIMEEQERKRKADEVIVSPSKRVLPPPMHKAIFTFLSLEREAFATDKFNELRQIYDGQVFHGRQFVFQLINETWAEQGSVLLDSQTGRKFFSRNWMFEINDEEDMMTLVGLFDVDSLWKSKKTNSLLWRKSYMLENKK